jgi:hypothetical protein
MVIGAHRTMTAAVAQGSIIASLLLASAPLYAAAPVDIGPEPEWESAKAEAIRYTNEQAGFFDPYSTHYQFRRGGIVRDKKGWLVCGRVNAKNLNGGYAGYSAFWVRIVNGQPVRGRMAPQGLGLDVCDITDGFE